MSEFYIPGIDDKASDATWTYNPKAPKPSEHTHDELETLYSGKEFPFEPKDYTPGELGYIACFGDRVIRSFQEAKAKLTEEDADKESKEKNLDELIKITINRTRVVQMALLARIATLPRVFYYRSRITGQPFIDARSRSFVFTDPTALAKAKERSQDDKEFSGEYASPRELSQLLYLNGCEKLVLNEGHLAFNTDLADILPPSEAAQGENKVPDPIRALRFFMLAFAQILRSPHEGEKQKTLQMLESQISVRLLQSQLFFAAKNRDGEKTEFLVLTDGNGHKALGAYTDKWTLPQDDNLYPALPPYNIAYQLTNESNELDGIIVNPGQLNFYLDKAWLKRLVNFGQKVVEKAKEKQAEQNPEK